MNAADVVVVALLFAIVGVAVVGGYAKIHANSACLSHGYADVKGSILIGFYCIKRVDQTDVVVPLESLRK